MSSLLRLQDVGVAFGGRAAVKKLDLHLAAGEALALVGESGCGKSTTAMAIMGLLPSTAHVSGAIHFEGRDTLTLRPAQRRALRGSGMAMIFQEPMTSLNPVMTIGRQIAEVLLQHRPLSRRDARKRAIELLELVQIPDAVRRIDDFPHHLSGGQLQRVMIAIAIACEPRLLIADEPTTALDVTIQAQILALLDTLRREMQMALLLITHDLGVVGQIADRVAVMYDGEKLEEGPVDAIFDSPRHAYTQGLLGASLTLAHDQHYRDSRLAEVRAKRDEASGRVTFSLRHDRRISAAPDTPDMLKTRRNAQVAQTAHATRAAGAPLLRVRDLQMHYTRNGRTLRAVDGVSLDIARGETLGLVGESGCGKSTLSRTLLRLNPATAGTIELDGIDITQLHGNGLRTMRRTAQMVFQDPFGSLNPRHTVHAMLDAALRVHDVHDADERAHRIRDVLECVGLQANALHRYAHEFSGGQRQRIGIARALVLRPSLLICDEPVSALDVSVRAQVLNLLVELKRELGLSYLFISHDLAVVRYIADRVLVMHEGRIVEAGDHRSLWSRPQHAYTRQLIAAVPAVRGAPRPNQNDSNHHGTQRVHS
ncbi:ABC transporter ATP-binding protein [Paraburkholderia sp.]|uniref:ABC transporter ATP-binding protein n=1 Tax=Paraburkholderia sp. TaxID=1926495 RepID=UPI00239FAA68|nr:ABC transporter ATP-binding protein [Paraburkholderia sp.]MDE1180853.1 ABC transporter ATP-binding protein [Paraburkholderia sp.]